MPGISNRHYLINQPSYDSADGRPQLLRIFFSDHHTRFDFGYQATDYYFKGGWVKISPKTFVRINGKSESYTMVKAENIAVAPQKHHFNTTKDWLYFSLYFPPLPLRSCTLDLIEADPGNSKDFNYHNIRIDKADALECVMV
jgi:hypothetical protein